MWAEKRQRDEWDVALIMTQADAKALKKFIGNLPKEDEPNIKSQILHALTGIV